MNDTDLYNGIMTVKMTKQVREDYKRYFERYFK